MKPEVEAAVARLERDFSVVATNGPATQDVRTLITALREAERDAARLDHLEREYDEERRAGAENRTMPKSLFRTNSVITRAKIDAAIAKGTNHD